MTQHFFCQTLIEVFSCRSFQNGTADAALHKKVRCIYPRNDLAISFVNGGFLKNFSGIFPQQASVLVSPVRYATSKKNE